MVEVSKERIKRVEEQIYEIRKKISDIHGPDSVGERTQISIDNATTLDDFYFRAVMDELRYGELNPVEEGSHAGEVRLEFPNFLGCIKNPTSKPFAPQAREGIPVIADEERIEKYFNEYILDGALNPNEHYRYSSWINGIPKLYSYKKAEEIGLFGGDNKTIPLEHNGIPRGTNFSQLEWCANHFGKKGYGTNHCYITVGCAEGLKRYDWPYDPNKDESSRGSTECLRGISLKIRRGNKLDVTTIWRSWDLYEGLPMNLGGFAHFMEYTCDLINSVKKDSQPEVEPGRLYAQSDGLHIYDHSLDLAKIWTNIK